ncbi:MAG TPA: CpsD/CapB family tyrosine-protein kinase, partial [Tissierellaceae bacterium]|nr:CpsD/CapB family tyrosine-protein kinase [Tissierellaceae bacterium]
MKIRNIWGETVRNIGLITQTNPKSPMAEAFRTLRTNIQFANIDEEIESMVITSGQPSEGKSTVAINLALTIGQGGKRVLLIDCDMRKPTIHKTFRISNLFGLTNILMGTKTLEEVLYSQEERLGSV